MRTKQEIEVMIQRLNEERDSTPEYSAFGDPNWKLFQAQIEALEWAVGDREDEDLI